MVIKGFVFATILLLSWKGATIIESHEVQTSNTAPDTTLSASSAVEQTSAPELGAAGSEPSVGEKKTWNCTEAKAAAPPQSATQTAAVPVEFVYTSSNTRNCKELDAEGYNRWRCPGHGGYDLNIIAHEHGSLLEVYNKTNQKILEGPAIHDGTLSTNVVEWRFRMANGAPQVHGLIFRIYSHRGDNGEALAKPTSDLYAARIDGARSCVVGTTKSNTTARAMADDPNRPCQR